jgi:opacity protein-like surface antigen
MLARHCMCVTRSQTAFGMAFGGGIDWEATRSVSIRIIQADYERVNFTGNAQNNIMISAGVVFTFGRR